MGKDRRKSGAMIQELEAKVRELTNRLTRSDARGDELWDRVSELTERLEVAHLQRQTSAAETSAAETSAAEIEELKEKLNESQKEQKDAEDGWAAAAKQGVVGI